MDKKSRIKVIVPLVAAVALLLILSRVAYVYFCLPRALPSEALKSLSGEVAVDADGDLSGNIHNGTRWEVTGVVIRLTLYTQASTPKGWQIVSSPCSDDPTQIPADGKSFLVRDYALDTRIKPLSVNTFSERGGIIQVKEDWYGCQITGAQGLVERPTMLRRRPRSSGIPTPPGHQQAWWIPAIYTFLGAVIGFLSDRLKIWWDSSAVKKAFLSAIRVELEGLQEQLSSLKKEVLNAKERLERIA